MPKKKFNDMDGQLNLVSVPPRGEQFEIDSESDAPQLYYQSQNGQLYTGDCLQWLKGLEPETVDLIFADPPYNIGKAQWDSFKDDAAYVRWSEQWIQQAHRVLKKRGTLYICGFSEILADLKQPALKYFRTCRWLVWH